MFRRLIPTTVILGSLVTGACAQADDNRRHRPDSPRVERHEPSRAHRQHRHARPHRADQVVLEARLHRRVHNESLPLRQLVRLDRDYRGYTVESVVVRLRPNSGRGRLNLMVNGVRVDRDQLHGDRVVRLSPDRDRVIGADIRRLELGVRGRAFIQEVEVRLSRPQHRRGRHYSDRAWADEVARLILGEIAGIGRRQ